MKFVFVLIEEMLKILEQMILKAFLNTLKIHYK